jgi:hypothetical protein
MSLEDEGTDRSAPKRGAAPRFIARWDLDKTYLRTDFDTLKDLVRTAIERPDQKRTVPGAAIVLRELGRAGVETHILSGSPKQLRSRIVEKLRLDGVRFSSLTLKPNLENLLRFRFKAIRGQLGYKLPSLLLRRAELEHARDADGALVREALLGDDAEADAFVYRFYADVVSGAVDDTTLERILRAGSVYDDVIDDALRFTRYVDKGAIVERILIHLERQSSPSDFAVFGPLVVPFYNYLQAAFIFFEDGRLPARSVLRVAADLVTVYNFERTALTRSYVDLHRRGHVQGTGIGALEDALSEFLKERRSSAGSELVGMVSAIAKHAGMTKSVTPPPSPPVDYDALVHAHNPRRKRKKAG